MPGLRQQDLDEIFVYHDPDPKRQVPKYERIRNEARLFASTILNICPPSAEQTTAIRKVQEAVMFANAAIAIHTKEDPNGS
jgi:hypothetical protein